MFTTTLAEFKTTQNELHRQAAHYRLLRSLEQSRPLTSRLIITFGQLLVKSGRELLTLSGLPTETSPLPKM